MAHGAAGAQAQWRQAPAAQQRLAEARGQPRDVPPSVRRSQPLPQSAQEGGFTPGL